MESLILQEENIIKDLSYLFRLKKVIDDTVIKDVRNLFRLTIILNMKVNVIKIKHYQLESILIKLDHN